MDFIKINEHIKIINVKIFYVIDLITVLTLLFSYL